MLTTALEDPRPRGTARSSVFGRFRQICLTRVACVDRGLCITVQGVDLRHVRQLSLTMLGRRTDCVGPAYADLSNTR